MSQDITQVLLSGVIAFILVMILVPVLIKLAYFKNIYDRPDDHRKIHSRYVSHLGGVALFISILVGFSLSGFADSLSGYPYFVVALVILFFTGLKDDLAGLSPYTKISVEIIAALLVILGGNMLIDNLHGVFGIYELHYWTSLLLTLFTFVVVMNAYNLIDGIDGLATGIGMIASFFMGAGFLIAGLYPFAILAFFITVTLFSFLFHNFQPASIFMGDSGSLLTGFVLAVLAVNFVGLSGVEAFAGRLGNTSPVLAAVFLVVPLYDTLRIFMIRLYNKTSPFKPDLKHVHHVLLNAGFSHGFIAIYLYAAMMGIIAVSLTAVFVDAHLVLALCVMTTVLLLPTFGVKRALLVRLGILPRDNFHASMLFNGLNGHQLRTRGNGHNVAKEEKARVRAEDHLLEELEEQH